MRRGNRQGNRQALRRGQSAGQRTGNGHGRALAPKAQVGGNRRVRCGVSVASNAQHRAPLGGAFGGLGVHCKRKINEKEKS